MSCVAELGWSGATVAVIAARAGVSRGATQHYFRTREDLLTAALAHMADVRLAEIRREAALLPAGEQRTRDVVGLLVRLYTGPLFRAALQIWAAAAASEQLRVLVLPLEAHLAARHTRPRSNCCRPTNPCPVSTRQCRRRWTLLAGWAWRTRWPTIPGAGTASSRSGRRCWTPLSGANRIAPGGCDSRQSAAVIRRMPACQNPARRPPLLARLAHLSEAVRFRDRH